MSPAVTPAVTRLTLMPSQAKGPAGQRCSGSCVSRDDGFTGDITSCAVANPQRGQGLLRCDGSQPRV